MGRFRRNGVNKPKCGCAKRLSKRRKRMELEPSDAGRTFGDRRTISSKTLTSSSVLWAAESSASIDACRISHCIFMCECVYLHIRVWVCKDRGVYLSELYCILSKK